MILLLLLPVTRPAAGAQAASRSVPAPAPNAPAGGLDRAALGLPAPAAPLQAAPPGPIVSPGPGSPPPGPIIAPGPGSPPPVEPTAPAPVPPAEPAPGTPAAPAAAAPAPPRTPPPAPPAGPAPTAPAPFAAPAGPAPALAGIAVDVRNADAVEFEEATNRWFLLGNVVVDYRDYHVTADVAEVDVEERTVAFRGRVTITTAERTLEGTLLSLNLRTREYILEGGRTAIPPQDLQMGVTAPVYAVAGRIRGIPGRIFVERGGITTCDLFPVPHYLFDSRHVDIIPGRRLKARNVSIYALGHKILTIPGITIPLRTLNEQSNRLVPVVGQSLDEGYFLKTAHFYVLGALVGNLRLDLMSKKGIAFGVDQPYTFAQNNGSIHAYHLMNRNQGVQDTNFRAEHHQQLGEFNVQFNGDFRRNSLSYLSTDSDSLLTDLSVDWRGKSGANTNLGINRSANSFGDITTGTWIGRLRHTQSIGKLNGTLNFDLSEPFGLATASAGRLTSRLDLTQQSDLVDVALVVDKVDILGGTANYFSGIQRLPEVRLTTNTGRFLPGEFWRTYPFSGELLIGNLEEAGFSSVSTTTASRQRVRTALRLQGSPQFSTQDRGLTFSMPIDFQQIVYKSNEAQWIAGTSPSLRYSLGGASQATLSYSLVRQNGFTPFQFDFAPEYNSLSLGVVLGPRIGGGQAGAYPGYGSSAYGGVGPLAGYGGFPSTVGGRGLLNPAEAGKANVSFDSGYDFENDFARDLVVRAQYQPTTHHLVGLSTGYDWLGKRRFGNASRLRDIRGRLRVDYGSRLQLSVGALWDTDRDRLGTIRTMLNTSLGTKWQLQSLLGSVATGFGPSEPYAQVMLTRDLHCWEASAIYRQETTFGQRQQDFRLLLSLKAFPINKEFGVTQSGQYLTTDVGDIY